MRCLEPSQTHGATSKCASPASDDLLCACRSGYLTLEYVVQVVDNYTLAEIPLETVVIDTEAWDNREIFQLSDGYPQKDIRAFADRLHRDGQRWVSLSPASVAAQQLLCFSHGFLYLQKLSSSAAAAQLDVHCGQLH